MGVFAAQELRQFIERAERVKEEIKGIQQDLKEVFDEAKSRGYDVAAMKDVIKLRAMEKDARESAVSMVSLYAEAVGMDMTPIELAVKAASPTKSKHN